MLSPFFLCQRKINEKHSSWTNLEAGVLQESILGPLFFLIYGSTSNLELFAEDSSLFSVVQNRNSTANNLNNDLMKINDSAFQWKAKFNPDPKKQAQEMIFSRKINKINRQTLHFNQNLVKSSSTHKHLGMVLDTILDFSLHLKNMQKKVNKTIRLLSKL